MYGPEEHTMAETRPSPPIRIGRKNQIKTSTLQVSLCFISQVFPLNGMIKVCLPSWMLWTLLRAIHVDQRRQALDAFDDDEPANRSTSLQKNKIFYKSQRKVVRRRHPIPPSFQQPSDRRTRLKGTRLREEESRGDWDMQGRGVWRGAAKGGVKRAKVNAWASI